MEVVGVAQVGAGFFYDLGDGGGIELAGFFEDRGGEGAAELHGAGAALFEWSVVEEGVGIGVEYLVRELRGQRSIDGDGSDAAVADGLRTPRRPSMSMASCMTSFMTSSTRGWSGILISPSMFSKQAATWGRRQASRSSERMRWICGGTFLPFWKRSRASERLASQRKRVAKIGEPMRTACWRMSSTVSRLEEVEDIGEGEAVLLGERDVDAVVGGGGLQFEVERAAETLAQGQAPGLVDAAPKGAWITNCMPPPSSKKRSAMTHC